jgi:hypothetical protein
MKRKSLKKPKTPGMGRYEYKSYIGEGPKYSFGRIHTDDNKENDYTKKSVRYKKFEVPGPGFYTIQDKNRGPKYSMYSRNHDSNKNLRKIKSSRLEVPGVGKYELRKDMDLNVPTFKFSQSPRNNLVLNDTALKYPEPGKYDIDYKFICTTTPSWSFSHEPRFPYLKTEEKKVKYHQNPGPGAYTIKDLIGNEGPFFTFSKLPEAHMILDKDDIRKSKENPSVGKYINNINYKADFPFYTFIKEPKDKKGNNEKEQKSSPGPIYNPNKYISSTIPNSPHWSWALSKVTRDEDDQKNSKKKKTITPGPGEYNYKGDTIPQGPKFTMRQILKKIKIVDFPGPGEYNLRKEKDNSNWGYTLGKEKRDQELRLIEKEAFPGPGKYAVKDVDLVKCFTFSKSKKLPQRKDSFPGPGSYKIPSSFNFINNMTREKGAYNPRFKYI